MGAGRRLKIRGCCSLPAWETTQPSLSRDDDRVMQWFWGEYRERLDRVRLKAASCQSSGGLCPELELSMIRPVRQPARVGIGLTIATTLKRIWKGEDGQERAERREAAWYRF